MQDIVIVLGHGGESVLEELAEYQEKHKGITITAAWQRELKGTGDAVQIAWRARQQWPKHIFIINGDGPLITAETLNCLTAVHQQKRATLSLGCMELSDPTGYGRVVEKAGLLHKVVEEADASPKERSITRVNGGIYLASRDFLQEFLPKLSRSKVTSEVYVTQLISLGTQKKKRMASCLLPRQELLSINDLMQLSEVEEVIRLRIIRQLQKNGVRFMDPRQTYIEQGVVIEAGASIGAGVHLEGKVHIAKAAKIETGVCLKDVSVQEGAHIKAYSYLEDSHIGEGAVIGPFAHVRPGTTIGNGARIGNFVEIKKTRIGDRSKVSHLSYVGDAEVEADVNLGCGFITCNYDGFRKHKTVVREGAFVGSDVQVVAPAELGENCYVASGTTITKNVPKDALAIARTPQENKNGYATKLRDRFKQQSKSSKERHLEKE